MSDDEEHGVISTTITITRRYYPDRDNPEHRDVISVDTTGEPTLLESFGLLEFAKHSLASDFNDDDDPEEFYQ